MINLAQLLIRLASIEWLPGIVRNLACVWAADCIRAIQPMTTEEMLAVTRSEYFIENPSAVAILQKFLDARSNFQGEPK
jgi:hypothetical protein